MTGNCDLFIDDVIHKALMAVDEAGAEAPAASAAS
jgi:serine protease inhibitor